MLFLGKKFNFSFILKIVSLIVTFESCANKAVIGMYGFIVTRTVRLKSLSALALSFHKPLLAIAISFEK